MPGKKKGLPAPGRSLITSLFFFFISVATVHAHGVHVFARLDGDLIVTESYFSDERKVNEGVIRVYDPSGALLLEGKTDDKGVFSFKVPQETDLKIVLEVSMGHRAEYLLTAEELTGRASTERQPERGPGLLEAGVGIGIILLIAGLTYFGRRKWGLKLKKERNQ